MSDTKIPYATKTFNPLVGCPGPLVSPGCEHCWARSAHDKRHHAKASWKNRPAMYREPFSKLQWFPERLAEPLRWRKPQTVFVGSQTDLFHAEVTDEMIATVFARMLEARHHTFLTLTKRPQRMLELLTRIETGRATKWGKHAGTPLPDHPWLKGRVWQLAWGQGAGMANTPADVYLSGFDSIWPPKHVLLGATACTQSEVDRATPILAELAAQGWRTWLSLEPLLEGVHLPWDAVGPRDVGGIEWIAVGGEAGPGARPFDIAWARSVVAQCRAAETKCFVKQMGRRGLGRGCDLDGRDPAEWPQDIRVRELPEIGAGK